MGKLILIDGNSLANRAFYAVPPLTNRDGFVTNAIFGFCNMLARVMKEEKPDYLAVAFDAGKIVFRHRLYEGYKGSRKSTPEELKAQFPVLKELLTAMGIYWLELPGYEADDIIGTLAARGSRQGITVKIITGDRDCFQLIDEHTSVLFTRKGISELEEFDQAHLKEVYDLAPWQIVELKGLMGDSSDDIPGVPGVGEKTAIKLLHAHESVAGVLDNVDQYVGKKLGERLAEHGDLARLSRQLALIDREVPVEVSFAAMAPGPGDKEEKVRLLQRLEFKGMLAEASKEREAANPAAGVVLGGVPSGAAPVTGVPAGLALETVSSAPARCLQREEELSAFLAPLAAQGGELFMVLGVSGANWRTFSWQAIGLARPGAEAVCLLAGAGLEPAKAMPQLAQVLSDPRVTKVFVDAKQAYLYCGAAGAAVSSPYRDLHLMGYLLNPADPWQMLPGLEELEPQHLARSVKAAAKLGQTFWNEAWIGRLLAAMIGLATALPKALAEVNMASLYQQAEEPLALILGEMERQGILLAPEVLEEIGQTLKDSIDATAEAVYRLAGEEFNLNSPKQLGEVLFEKLKLPKGKKTKTRTGYSTDAETLEYLALDHEIAGRILSYRQYAKLQSTYVEGLLAIMDPATKRIHTSLNQTITVTGRLSSTEPNLQNIPIRMEEGRQIRRAFLPSPGHCLLSGDYSQIELRILAHLCGDETLQEAFRQGQDIHRKTAAEVFGLLPEEVTPQQRRAAKAVNFGLIYGISEFGLAQDLGILRDEAKAYMERYFQRYPRVKQYFDRLLAEAGAQGYVETLFHRRRYLPELKSTNYHTRSFGQRAAMNAPIQGTAADIIKLAMVAVRRLLAEAGEPKAMVLQVHDELLFDLPRTRALALKDEIRQAMEQVVTLAVPLQVDLKIGPDWYAMEHLS